MTIKIQRLRVGFSSVLLTIFVGISTAVVSAQSCDPSQALNTVIELTDRGRDCIDAGDNEQAILDLNRAIEIDPNYARAYNNRGVAYRRVDDLQASLADLNQALTLDPNYAKAYYNRGLTNFDMNNLDRALDDFQRALDLRYDSLQNVYQMQGWTYFHKGDYNRATSAFQQAIGVDSQFANAYWGLGDVSRQLGDFDQAVEYYLQYIYIARDEARPEIVAYVNSYMGEPQPSSGGGGSSNTYVLGMALLSIIGIWLRWRFVKGQWSTIQERNRKPKHQRVEEQIAFSEKRKL